MQEPILPRNAFRHRITQREKIFAVNALFTHSSERNSHNRIKFAAS